ncbi:hypothetical protein T07_13402 [Trichinella nelsoni]|uniref:Uncharacterized protein n=1 Tax=Trichinella nelsoni TaxID=6336 RepID=A0A0V0S3D2_9BILA|nr:hypothetical protein T07_13402 [Trichinella nelsoni]
MYIHVLPTVLKFCNYLKDVFIDHSESLGTKKLFKVRSMIIIFNATQIYNEQYIAALSTHDYEHKLKITVDQ